MRRVNASIMILSITTILYSIPSEITTRDAGARAHGFSFTGIEKVAKSQFLEKFKDGAAKEKIMVLLKNREGNKGLRISENVALMKKTQSAIRTRLDKVVNTLDADNFQLRNRFENIPVFSGEATFGVIKALSAMDEVEAIEEDREIFINTSQGISLIGANELHLTHYEGAGTSIAIVDTGVDYTHTTFGSYHSFPNSKVIGGYDFGDDDTDPMDCEGHGTACASIAAGQTDVWGVAPAAKIYALKIVKGCNTSARTSDIVAAWDWCVTHKNDDPGNPIMVINTSFGGGYFTSPCNAESPVAAAAAANAVDHDITIFVSSGNEGRCDGINYPACLTDVISVGAVYDAHIGNNAVCVPMESCAAELVESGCEYAGTDHACFDDTTAADQITCYSNSANFLDVLAPSDCVRVADVMGSGGINDGNYTTCFGGTSAACPYAAGAGALLQNYAKSHTGSYLAPAQVKSLLVNHGNLITDEKNQLTHPKINVYASATAITDSNCTSDAYCNDGLFCNGVEWCVEGECHSGDRPCSEDTLCREDTDFCGPKDKITPTTSSTTTTKKTYNSDSCILTRVYGEYSDEVALMRFYRDNLLSRTMVGQEIIKLYYELSPMITMALDNDEELKQEVKEMVNEVVLLMEE